MVAEEGLDFRDPQDVVAEIGEFIASRLTRSGRAGCLLGLSGGLDSAVVAALAVRALGTEQVAALFLPERDSSPQSRRDAQVVAGSLGLSLREISLTPALRAVGAYRGEPSPFLIPRPVQERYVRGEFQARSKPGESPFIQYLKGGGGDARMARHIAYMRAKHRLRMVTLYLTAERENRLLLGACNKSEWLTGFFVPYGDSAADLQPIVGLFKTQVRQLAVFLGLPQAVVSKPPSPDLAPGLTDEFTLGLNYEHLDRVLWGIEEGRDDAAIAQAAGVEPTQVVEVREMECLSAPWRQLPAHP